MDRMQPPPYYGSPYQGEMPPSSYPYPTPGERKEGSEPTATPSFDDNTINFSIKF